MLVHNLSAEAGSRDIWAFFNGSKTIIDIILLSKIHINNFRIGFISVSGIHQAEDLIRRFNGEWFMGQKLSLRLANNSRARSYKPNTSSPFSRNSMGTKNVAKHKERNPQPTGLKVSSSNVDTVEQPKFNTIYAMKNDNLDEEIERSLIGVTKKDEWADTLQEKILTIGLRVLVRGLSHRKFLLTFEDTEEKNNFDIVVLGDFFSSVKEVPLVDLIVLRITWV